MQNKILIVVPSKGRHKSIFKLAYSFLQYSKYKNNFKIFVEPQDFELYESNGEEFANHLVKLDANDKGLNYAKIQIKEYAEKNNFTHIFKIDDDLKGLRDMTQRSLPKEQRIKNDKKWRVENIFDKLIEDSIELFNFLGDKIKGVATIPGHFLYNFSGKKWTNYNAPFKGSYISATEFFSDENTTLNSQFEDLETYLNILQKGFITIEYGLTGFDHDIFKLEGGHQSSVFLKRRINEESKKQELEIKFPGLKFAKNNGDKIFIYRVDFRKTTINGSKILKSKKVEEDFPLNKFVK